MTGNIGWRPDYWTPLDDETLDEIEGRAEQRFVRLLKILGSRAQRREEHAKGEILWLADLLARLTRVKESAPQIKEVRNDLRKIAGRLSQAADLFEGLDHPAFRALVNVGMDPDYLKALSEGAHSFPVSFMRRLSSLADDANKELASHGAGAWPLATKREFIVECLTVFDRYRPGEASSKARAVGGDFHEFVALVFTVATGEQASDFESSIKRVVLEWAPRRNAIEEWENSPEGRYARYLTNCSRKREIETYIRSTNLEQHDLVQHNEELALLRQEIGEYESGGHTPPGKRSGV